MTIPTSLGRIARVLAVCALVAGIATPALAQTGQIKGKVVDAQNKPVEKAKVTLENTANGRKNDTTTDKKGEFMQIGLMPGTYKVFAEKEGLQAGYEVKLGIETKEVNFVLKPGGANSAAAAAEEAKKIAEKNAAIKGKFDEGVALLNAGKLDEAIAKFDAALTDFPKCLECANNIGAANVAKQDYDSAEKAYKKALEINPESPDVYSGLANVYNSQKKFKEAAEMSAEAAKRMTAPAGATGGGGANAGALYNQAVISWNGQDIPKTKELLDAALKADPNHPDSHFMMGKVLINMNQLGEAATEFETYLKLAPNGPAARVKEAKDNFEALKGFRKVGVADNLKAVRARIDEAARRAGRAPGEITLVAVSKTFGIDAVREAYQAGQRDFGENKVQEALQKIDAGADMRIRWHLIGHLQSNKARKTTGFACIHSIESVELLTKVDSAAAEAGTAPELLVQVDLAGETTKFGAAADEARRVVEAALDCKAARLTGLMLLPPWNEDQEQTRPWFVRLRELRDAWIADGIPAGALGRLSMGMSHDFEAAIEEGATMVRVGTAIFGRRTVKA